MTPTEYYNKYLSNLPELRDLSTNQRDEIVRILGTRLWTVNEKSDEPGSFSFATHDAFDIDFWLSQGMKYMCDDEFLFYRFDTIGGHAPMNLWYALKQLENQKRAATIQFFGYSPKLAYEVYHRAPRKPTADELRNRMQDNK